MILQIGLLAALSAGPASPPCPLAAWLPGLQSRGKDRYGKAVKDNKYTARTASQLPGLPAAGGAGSAKELEALLKKAGGGAGPGALSELFSAAGAAPTTPPVTRELPPLVLERLSRGGMTPQEISQMARELAFGTPGAAEAAAEGAVNLESPEPDPELEAMLEFFVGDDLAPPDPTAPESASPELDVRVVTRWFVSLGSGPRADDITLLQFRDRSPFGHELFRRLDRDGNGRISFLEFSVPVVETAGRQGFLIQPEFLSWIESETAKKGGLPEAETEAVRSPEAEERFRAAQMLLARARAHLTGDTSELLALREPAATDEGATDDPGAGPIEAEAGVEVPDSAYGLVSLTEAQKQAIQEYATAIADELFPVPPAEPREPGVWSIEPGEPGEAGEAGTEGSEATPDSEAPVPPAAEEAELEEGTAEEGTAEEGTGEEGTGEEGTGEGGTGEGDR